MEPIKSVITSITNKDISLASKKAFVPEPEATDGEN